MPENRITYRVQWGDADAAGIVFYPNYYRWFDFATHALFRGIGYSVGRMLDEGMSIPLVESRARYLATLRFDDEVTIVSRIAEIRTRAFAIEHLVYHADVLACEGLEARIWVRVVEGGIEPQPIPPALRRVLEGE